MHILETVRHYQIGIKDLVQVSITLTNPILEVKL